MRKTGIFFVFILLCSGSANAAQTSNGATATAERAQYCAKAHPADFYDMWIHNRCSKAPYGVKFEYLHPAWSCLCLGVE